MACNSVEELNTISFQHHQSSQLGSQITAEQTLLTTTSFEEY